MSFPLFKNPSLYLQDNISRTLVEKDVLSTYHVVNVLLHIDYDASSFLSTETDSRLCVIDDLTNEDETILRITGRIVNIIHNDGVYFCCNINSLRYRFRTSVDDHLCIKGILISRKHGIL